MKQKYLCTVKHMLKLVQNKSKLKNWITFIKHYEFNHKNVIKNTHVCNKSNIYNKTIFFYRINSVCKTHTTSVY